MTRRLSPHRPPMPLYAFTVIFSDGAALEPVSHRCPDADRAWEAARDMIAGLLAAQGDPRLFGAALSATDEAGEVVFDLPFAEVAAPPPDPRRH